VCLTSVAAAVGELPPPERQESYNRHPQCQPSRCVPGKGLQRPGLVRRRAAAGRPGGLQRYPADQQVQDAAGGIANPGAGLQEGLVLDVAGGPGDSDCTIALSLGHGAAAASCADPALLSGGQSWT